MFGELITEVEKIIGRKVTDDDGNPLVHDQDPAYVAERAANFKIDALDHPQPAAQEGRREASTSNCGRTSKKRSTPATAS